MTLSEQVKERRMSQIERRLNELGSLVKGNQDFQADRIADVMEQVDDLRDQLSAIAKRVDRMAAYLNTQKGKTNDGS